MKKVVKQVAGIDVAQKELVITSLTAFNDDMRRYQKCILIKVVLQRIGGILRQSIMKSKL